MRIGNKTIGINRKPFIIAELSGNHKGSLKRAIKIIKQVKKTGASAVKLQTFDLDEMTIDLNHKNFKINDKKSPWFKKSLYELYTIAQTPKEWHEPIFNFCKKIGLICFSSVFDFKSLAFLETLDAPAYKIASFENNHFPLIEMVAKKKKPTIISTGMSTLSEIAEVVKIFKKNKNNNLALLKCTSSYPANPKESNLRAIRTLREKFKCEVGLSDHTKGIGAAVASVSIGASIIEKHVVLKKNDGSVDKDFSLDPTEFKNLVNEANSAWLALGNKNLKPTLNEKKMLKLKRSIFVTMDLQKGSVLNKKNIKIIRPGFGLHPKHYNNLIGKKINRKVKKGTPFKRGMV